MVNFLVDYFQKLKVNRWKNKHNLYFLNKEFAKIFNACDSFEISRKARLKQDCIDYTYGEIEFFSFIAFIKLIKVSQDDIFFDLGSGSGKAIIGFAMVENVQRYVGLELLEPLNDLALNQLTKFRHFPNYKKINFMNLDFLTADLSAATIIFINAATLTCWNLLAKKLTALPKLRYLLVISKRITAENFLLLYETKVRMSWGIVNSYIYKKIA